MTSSYNIFYRDIANPQSPSALQSVGSISAHTRPVECIDGRVISDDTLELCTADTMGAIKLWDVIKQSDGRYTTALKAEYLHHRTRINDLHLGVSHLWTGIVIPALCESR
jgi:hypothetical protein